MIFVVHSQIADILAINENRYLLAELPVPELVRQAEIHGLFSSFWLRPYSAWVYRSCRPEPHTNEEQAHYGRQHTHTRSNLGNLEFLYFKTSTEHADEDQYASKSKSSDLDRHKAPPNAAKYCSWHAKTKAPDQSPPLPGSV